VFQAKVFPDVKNFCRRNQFFGYIVSTRADILKNKLNKNSRFRRQNTDKLLHGYSVTENIRPR